MTAQYYNRVLNRLCYNTVMTAKHRSVNNVLWRVVAGRIRTGRGPDAVDASWTTLTYCYVVENCNLYLILPYHCQSCGHGRVAVDVTALRRLWHHSPVLGLVVLACVPVYAVLRGSLLCSSCGLSAVTINENYYYYYYIIIIIITVPLPDFWLTSLNGRFSVLSRLVVLVIQYRLVTRLDRCGHWATSLFGLVFRSVQRLIWPPSFGLSQGRLTPPPLSMGDHPHIWHGEA